MSQRITIDPVTRIEGHLRIDCEIGDGVVTKAWASGTMWRGMEEIVKNRDPRCLYHHTRTGIGACRGKCPEPGCAGKCAVYPQYHSGGAHHP